MRELYNVVEQAVALATTPIITPGLLETAIRGEMGDLSSFESARFEFERDYLAKLLKITNGNVTQAARLAKRNRTEFYKLLQRHHLNPSMFKPGGGARSAKRSGAHASRRVKSRRPVQSCALSQRQRQLDCFNGPTWSLACTARRRWSDEIP